MRIEKRQRFISTQSVNPREMQWWPTSLPEEILTQLQQWLKAPVVEENDDGQRRTRGGKGQRRGTPQGGVISPLLANLYLHLLERIWERHGLEDHLQARLDWNP